MACSEELVIPEEVPRMALKKGSGAVERVKGKEFARETLVVAEIENTSGDLEKDVAAMINIVPKLMMGMAKHSAVGDKFLCIFNDGKPIYTGKLAPVTDDIQKEKMCKDPVETGKAAAVKIYEIPTEKMYKAPVEAGKAVTAVDKIQLKKKHKALLKAATEAVAIYKNRMERSKALVEPLETGEALVETGKEAASIDKNQMEALVETSKEAVAVDKNKAERSKALVEALETGDELVETEKKEVAIDKNQTKMCAESDAPAGANSMHELSDDLVSFILAMPRETPVDTEDIPFMTSKYNLAKLLNRSEEWIEEQRQWFKEDAARDQKIYDDFEPLQNWVRGEFFENGYVEVDQECLNQVAELEEYARGLWDDWVNNRGGLAGIEFADPSDPECAVSCEPNYPEELLAL